MGAYLGPVGGLVHLKCASKLAVQVAATSTFRTALSGRRTEQVGARGRRVWEAEVSTAKPEQHHVLDQLALGLLPGPYVWYDELAQVTNVLTPEASTCAVGEWTGVVQGGATYPLGGAPFLRTLSTDRTGVAGLAVPVPVPHGVSVVASVHLTAAPGLTATLRVTEVDPYGLVVREHTVNTAAGAVLERVHLALTTSLRTVALRFEVVGAVTIAGPAVTLTRGLQPWATGRGCHTVSLYVPGEDVQLAFEAAGDWGRRSAYSMTITELG